MTSTLFTALLLNLPANRALELDGSYVTAPAIQLSNTSDWTVQCEFSFDEVPAVLFDNQGSTAGDGFEIKVDPGRKLAITVNGTGSNVSDTLTEVLLEYGRHYHVAVTYEYDSSSGLGDIYWYLNGVKYLAITQADYLPTLGISDLYIGRYDHAPGVELHGRIDNILMTEDLLYTSDFNPSHTPPTPTANTLLFATFNSSLPDDASYPDESGTGNDLTAFGSTIAPVDTLSLIDGYARLNGFSSYMTLSDMDLNPGTDMTLEFDMRYQNPPGDMSMMTIFDALDPDPASPGGFSIRFNPQTQYLEVGSKATGTAAVFTEIATVIAENEWHRFAIVLESNTATTAFLLVYIDGTRVSIANVNYEQPPPVDLTVGARESAADTFDQYFSGHLDQMRLSNIARYASSSYNYYPDQLDNDGDAYAVWQMFSNDITPVQFPEDLGNDDLFATEVEAAHTLIPPFWLTPDLTPVPYTYVAPQPNWGNDWNIEFWYKRTDSSFGYFFDAFDDVTSTGHQIAVNGAHEIVVQVDSSFFNLGSIDPNAWNHIVIHQRIVTPGSPPTVRLRAIVNGIGQPQSAPFNPATDFGAFLLLANDDTDSFPLVGSMHSLRISSKPRYSGDFPPPRSALGSDSRTFGVWSMDEVTGSPLIDRSSNARDFELCDGNVTFITQPGDRTDCAGETVQFTVATFETFSTFQWFKDGTEMPGETANVLELVNIDQTDAADYDCLVSIGCDENFSDTATLTVTPIYQFTGITPDQTVCTDDTIEITVTLDLVSKGSGSYLLQWQKDSVNLAGETSETLTILNADASDSGEYVCRLQTDIGCPFSYSSPSTVTVSGPVAQAGIDRVLCLPGESLTLNGFIDCTAPGTIVWSGPGTIVDGDTLTPTVTPTAAVGDYFYTLRYDHMLGSTSDQVMVQVRDYSFAFGNGQVDIDDLRTVGGEWPSLTTIDYDVYPAGGDGFLDIRDLIALTHCDSYTP